MLEAFLLHRFDSGTSEIGALDTYNCDRMICYSICFFAISADEMRKSQCTYSYIRFKIIEFRFQHVDIIVNGSFLRAIVFKLENIFFFSKLSYV